MSTIPEIPENDVIPLANMGPEDFPIGTTFYPVEVIGKDGEKELVWIVITPDTLKPGKFDKEHDRILDMTIDKNLKIQKAKNDED